MKKELKNVTLLGIDCVDIDRLIQAAEICMKDFDFGAVKLLTSLESDNPNIVKINHIGSTKEYSEFMIKDLNKYVDTDFVLIIQYDGFILNPDAWIDEFLKYDYIGASWLIGSWETKVFPKELYGQTIVGNGGFSLRSKKLVEASSRLANEGKVSKFDPEDIAICVWYRDLFEKEGIKFAPVSLADKFSYEGDTDGTPWRNQLGFHGLSYTDISAWTAKHQEYKIENNLDNRTKEIKEKKKN